MGERSETHRSRRRHKAMGVASLTHPTREVRDSVIAGSYKFVTVTDRPAVDEICRTNGDGWQELEQFLLSAGIPIVCGDGTKRWVSLRSPILRGR
jgi:hypothetical protein